jgi:hypothetical protein
MGWTKETPTVSGYYWYTGYTDGKPEDAVDIAALWFKGETMEQDALVAHAIGDSYDYPVKDIGGYWYGPVEPPEFHKPD